MQALGPALILMKDKQGEEATSDVKLLHHTVIHNVLRGSLLTPIPAEEQTPRADWRLPHNYQTMYQEHTITLYCDWEDVAPLNHYESLLLAGVRGPDTRYQTFATPDKLDWGEQLKVGDRVLVSIPGPLQAESGATQKASAVIQYVGPVEGMPGVTFGVEILDPHYCGKGSTDGTFRDVRYFTCRDDNGLFVSFDKLSKDPAIGSLTELPPGGQCYTPHAGQQNGQRKPGPSPVPEPSTKPPHRFEVGDRVVFFNKSGTGIHGTVRWAGKYGFRDDKKKYHNFAAVGIETDVRVYSNELESYLPPRRYAFAVGKDKSQVFVQEEEAILEEDYMAGTPDRHQVQHTQKKSGEGKERKRRETEMEEMRRSGEVEVEERRRNEAYTRTPGPAAAGLDDGLSLLLGLTVQLAQNPNCTGVIRWTGYLPGRQGLIAGVELDKPMDGCGDGEWQGQRFFSCVPGKGFFCPAGNLRHNVHVEQELRQEVKQLQDQQRQQMEQLLVVQEQKEQLQREKQRLEQLQTEQQQQQEEQLRESQRHIQQLEQQKMQEVESLQRQLQQEQERNRRLQERLDTSAAEMEQIRPATQLLMSVQFKTVNRTEIYIEKIIGKGAWGEVAKGKFRGQPVAVKWPHMDLLQQYPNTVDRMRREVRIMAQVRHPNLVRFIAAVLDEAAERLQAPPMIITELLDTNLRLAYEQGRLQITDCVTILRDVAYALHYLHELTQPIIHRDISAPNVLLQALPNRGWLAKVSDFGSANLAKLARTAGEGAIIYTAPEAFPPTDLDTEPPPMTTKIDVYSYGVLVCEVLTSQPPFSESYRGMLQQVKGRWEFMYNLIVRCTKRSPQDRPTMAQVLDELNSLPRPPPRPLPQPHQ